MKYSSINLNKFIDGIDYFMAYSPERESGNKKYKTKLYQKLLEEIIFILKINK